MVLSAKPYPLRPAPSIRTDRIFRAADLSADDLGKEITVEVAGGYVVSDLLEDVRFTYRTESVMNAYAISDKPHVWVRFKNVGPQRRPDSFAENDGGFFLSPDATISSVEPFPVAGPSESGWLLCSSSSRS